MKTYRIGLTRSLSAEERRGLRAAAGLALCLVGAGALAGAFISVKVGLAQLLGLGCP